MAQNNATTSMLQAPKLKMSQLADLFVHNYFAGVEKRAGKPTPIMVWGPSGIGKSAIAQLAARRIAKRVGKKFIHQPPVELLHSAEIDDYFYLQDFRLAQETPVDSKGLVARHDTLRDYMTWLSPATIATRGTGIRLYDELPQAPKPVQAAYFQIINDRMSGNVKIPDGVMQLAAGNDASMRGVYNEMPPALGNRFIQVWTTHDLDEWIEDFALPTGVHHSIISFHRWTKGEWLHRFDPSNPQEQVFPSPRSWDFVSTLIDMPEPLRHAVISGSIGNAAAAKFGAYLRTVDQLPNPLDILTGKIRPYPKEQDILFALTGAVVAHFEQKHVPHFNAWVQGLPKEFAVLTYRTAMRSDKKYWQQDPAAHKWIMANKNLML